ARGGRIFDNRPPRAVRLEKGRDGLNESTAREQFDLNRRRDGDADAGGGGGLGSGLRLFFGRDVTVRRPAHQETRADRGTGERAGDVDLSHERSSEGLPL